MPQESTKSIVKQSIYASLGVIGFALFFAIIMPKQTHAWEYAPANEYWLGVAALCVFLSGAFYVGNKLSGE